jgi:hypothetical protein
VGGATGGSQAASGGTLASGGATFGTSTLDCVFSYSDGSYSVTGCHVSGSSQHTCADAAACICADPARTSSCYGWFMSPHGSASFTDYCAPAASSPNVRTLTEALTGMAGSGGVTASADCSAMRALL